VGNCIQDSPPRRGAAEDVTKPLGFDRALGGHRDSSGHEDEPASRTRFPNAAPLGREILSLSAAHL